MAAAAPDGSDTLLLHNARVTADPDATEREWAWVLVRGGRVERLGAAGEAEPEAARRLDCGGRRVLPGLVDAHIHVQELGRSLVASADLHGLRSVEALREKLAAAAAGGGAGAWVFGHGWEQDRLGRYPTREDLDAAVGGETPALVWRVCHHVCVVSSAAQRALGLEAGGSGLLEEDEAVEAALRAETGTPEAERRRWLAAGARECARRGVTAVQTNDRAAWAGYAALAEAGELPVRVFLTVNWDEVASGAPGTPAAGARHPSGLLSCDRLKLFSDGSLGAGTAALTTPGGDDPLCRHGPHLGRLLVPPAEMAERVAEAGRRGYRVEMHAIGDAAADVALAAFEAAGSRRPLLTHCQVMRGPQIDAMARLGVVANVQPQFVVTDSRWADAKLGPLGLLEYAYAWRTMLRRGVRVAGGSDAPIEVPDPFDGMRAAVFRDWRPHEALTVPEALRAYTRGAAHAACAEDRLGALLPGYEADFVVCTHDLVADPEQLRVAGPAEVWVAGRRVE